MFSSKLTSNLAFVSRQISELSKRTSLDSAFQQLSDASDGVYDADIDRLRGLVGGKTPEDSGLGPSPFDTLAMLLPTPGADRDILFRGVVAYVQRSKVLFETYWAGLVGLAWYIGHVFVVAAIVGFIFVKFVLPSFYSAVADIYSSLPAFSLFVFEVGGRGIAILLLAMAVFFGATLYFMVLFHRRIQSLAPLPKWPSWLPFVGSVSETYNLGLFLNFAHLLCESGVKTDVAIGEAARVSAQPDSLTLSALKEPGAYAHSKPLTELGIAARLDQAPVELAHQCDEHASTLALALIKSRDRMSLLLKLVLFVFVGLLVIAMYLPIFKMGSVV